MISSELRNESSMVVNVLSITSGFKNKDPQIQGDTTIRGGGLEEVSNREIERQFRNRNVCFAGTDGKGNHAHFYIEDEGMRKEIYGVDKNGKEIEVLILTDDACEKIFNTKKEETFKDLLSKHVVTLGEKGKIVAYAQKIHMLDFNKMQIMSDVLEIPFEDILSSIKE